MAHLSIHLVLQVLHDPFMCWAIHHKYMTLHLVCARAWPTKY